MLLLVMIFVIRQIKVVFQGTLNAWLVKSKRCCASLVIPNLAEMEEKRVSVEVATENAISEKQEPAASEAVTMWMDDWILHLVNNAICQALEEVLSQQPFNEKESTSPSSSSSFVRLEHPAIPPSENRDAVWINSSLNPNASPFQFPGIVVEHIYRLIHVLYFCRIIIVTMRKPSRENPQKLESCF